MSRRASSTATAFHRLLIRGCSVTWLINGQEVTLRDKVGGLQVSNSSPLPVGRECRRPMLVDLPELERESDRARLANGSFDGLPQIAGRIRAAESCGADEGVEESGDL